MMRAQLFRNVAAFRRVRWLIVLLIAGFILPVQAERSAHAHDIGKTQPSVLAHQSASHTHRCARDGGGERAASCITQALLPGVGPIATHRVASAAIATLYGGSLSPVSHIPDTPPPRA